MTRFERQDFDAEQRTDVHLEGPLRITPRRPHFTTRLGDEGEAVWNTLPPLNGANKFANLSASGRVLLESGSGDPILVASEYGLGRVLAFAGDSTYRWYRSGKQTAHKRFWRQVVLWLAKKDNQDGQAVSVTMDQRRFPAGAKPDFMVTVSGEQPTEKTEVRAFLVRPNLERTSVTLVRRSAGSYQGSAPALTEPGEYKIEARLMSGERISSKANLPFQVLDSGHRNE